MPVHQRMNTLDSNAEIFVGDETLKCKSQKQVQGWM